MTKCHDHYSLLNGATIYIERHCFERFCLCAIVRHAGALMAQQRDIMIELRHDIPSGNYHIRSYKPNEVVINDKTYDKSLIVSPHTLIENWRPLSIDDLQANDWTPVITLQPKIVLLGTGNKLIFPATEFLAPLIEQKIGYEIMDTAAACRTFTILMAEERQVVAALILS